MPRKTKPKDRKNYGISWAPRVNGFFLRLGRRNIVNPATGEKYPYHYRFFYAPLFGGKTKALTAARLERDEILARPEFAAYLQNKALKLLGPETRPDKFSGVILLTRFRDCATGGQSLSPEVRGMYRRESRASSPNKLSLFKSFCLVMQWRDEKCGRKKRKPAEMRTLFDKFLRNNAAKVRTLRAYNVPIWPDELKKNKGE